MLHRLLAALLIVVLAAPALAGERIIEARHTYVLGENDTRAQARRLCFEEARRKAVEQAGTWVESETRVRDMALSTDEVRTFASALVRAELVQETFLAQGDTFAVQCQVRAEVDADSLGKKLAAFAEDPVRRERLREQKDLEDAVLPPRGEGPQGETVRPPLDDLDKLEAARAKLRRETEQLSRAARAVVSRGMTPGEVQSLLGPPRVKKLNEAMTSTYECHNYGDLWVVFKDGLVACTRNHLEYSSRYRGDCHCAGFSGNVSW
ncbi:hypothetical protein [Desulfocurvus sp. DL9XJH121]